MAQWVQIKRQQIIALYFPKNIQIKNAQTKWAWNASGSAWSSNRYFTAQQFQMTVTETATQQREAWITGL